MCNYIICHLIINYSIHIIKKIITYISNNIKLNLLRTINNIDIGIEYIFKLFTDTLYCHILLNLEIEDITILIL